MIVPCPEGWTPEGWKPSAEQVKVLKTKDYNIFSVLQIQSKEVLICRMIADLLNPRGQHGAGAEYLKIFLRDCLGMKKNFWDYYLFLK